jgi:hypothetical protein
MVQSCSECGVAYSVDANARTEVVWVDRPGQRIRVVRVDGKEIHRCARTHRS